MPKPSTYLQLIEAKRVIAQLQAEIDVLREQMALMKGFTLQQAMDIAHIELNRDFGFGPDRNDKFAKGFKKYFKLYARLCVDDSEGDEEIVYTKSVMDRALQEACGEILPFDERYAPENLYLRDRDLKEDEL